MSDNILFKISFALLVYLEMNKTLYSNFFKLIFKTYGEKEAELSRFNSSSWVNSFFDWDAKEV